MILFSLNLVGSKKSLHNVTLTLPKQNLAL